MKKILLTIIISLFLYQSQTVKAESVNFYGFTPVSVDSLPRFYPNNKLRQQKEPVFLTVIAEINKKGKLKSLKPVDDEQTQFFKYVESYIRRLTFKPAKLYNKKIKSKIPIEVIFSKKIYSPMFKVPLLSDTLILDNELIKKTCTINKLLLPEVISFPSYYADVSVMDTSNRYPFIIEKISYKDDKLIGIENYISTYDPFVQHIESAILYSEIKLPKLKKKKFSSDLYLMVSFFQQLSYPIEPFYSESADSSNLLHHVRVKIINKFSQLLSEPIPKRIPSNKLPRQKFISGRVGESNISINIDTTGNASVLNFGVAPNREKSAILNLVSKLKFFPAINQKYELVEFRGYIHIESYDELDVRISYLWMN